MSDDRFQGFAWPQENWFRLPNNWTDLTHDIKSLAELKVVEYVLRHTWGYWNEKDKPKRISLDEFANGRKRKNGGPRIDRGTGLSRPAIRRGIKAAVEHGFLKMTEDRRDLGRIKRYFSPNMIPNSGDKDSYPHPNSVDNETLPQASNETLPRTRKDNLRKDNLGKNYLSGPTGPDANQGKSIPNQGKNKPSIWDHRCTREFHRVVSSHIKVNCRFNELEWANQFRLMRTRDQVPKADIRRTIEWYAKYIGGEYIPEAFAAKTFREKYREGKFTAAMMRNGDGGSPGSTSATPELVNAVLWELDAMGEGGADQQGVIDEALRRIGSPAGKVTPTMLY